MPAESPKPHSIQNALKASSPIHLPVMQPEVQHPRLWPRPLTLVGQFTGDQPPSLPTIESLIPTLWAPRQRVVVDVVSPLADNLFVFLFSNATDFIRVEAGAPWPVDDDDHHLLLKKWHPGIDPSHFFITSVPVWMTIWAFLPELLNPTMVFKISKTVGDIIDVDHRTLYRKELRYARVCIQLDWSKPVPPGVSVRCEGKLHWIFFDYERIPTVCLRCGVVGHEFWRCQRGVVGGDSVMDRAERVIEVMSRKLPRDRYNDVAADERQLESAERRGYQRNSTELPWFVWLSSVKGLREWRSRFEAAEDGEGDDDMLTSSQASDDDVERE